MGTTTVNAGYTHFTHQLGMNFGHSIYGSGALYCEIRCEGTWRIGTEGSYKKININAYFRGKSRISVHGQRRTLMYISGMGFFCMR